ncbi:MAG TPA: mitofilin family membrane protein [Stellaceae bacterium]|nr:mitofilin family membrane protein [Stellaceae bacterium]
MGWRQLTIGLGGAAVLVAALVGTAPFWASALPWGGVPARREAPPVARIEPPPTALSQPDQQNREREAAASAWFERLDRRVAALEARPPAPTSDIADIRQLLAKLSGAVADLTARVEAIDKEIAGKASSASTETALVLALLQIRGAVAAGRPFAAEYETLAALARVRPEIATAAAPLAGPAKTGVAGRAVLADRLRVLAGAIAAAKAPDTASEAASDWTDEVLARLRGLVTIRRIDNVAESAGPEAAVKAAERALAGGDLAAAVAALDGLSGKPAEAAGPWLRMARERLAVETALDRIAAALVTRLGVPANTPADAGPSR